MGCNCGGNCKGAQTEIRIKKMRENAKLLNLKMVIGWIHMFLK